MGADRIGEIGDRASKGKAAGGYGPGFTAEPLARKGARGGLRGMGNKFSSDKEFTEVGRMAEVGQGRRLQVEGSDKKI